jgi:hypothetical protein
VWGGHDRALTLEGIMYSTNDKLYLGTDLPTTRTRSCVANVFAHMLLICVLWIA